MLDHRDHLTPSRFSEADMGRLLRLTRDPAWCWPNEAVPVRDLLTGLRGLRVSGGRFYALGAQPRMVTGDTQLVPCLEGHGARAAVMGALRRRPSDVPLMVPSVYLVLDAIEDLLAARNAQVAA